MVGARGRVGLGGMGKNIRGVLLFLLNSTAS